MEKKNQCQCQCSVCVKEKLPQFGYRRFWTIRERRWNNPDNTVKLESSPAEPAREKFPKHRIRNLIPKNDGLGLSDLDFSPVTLILYVNPPHLMGKTQTEKPAVYGPGHMYFTGARETYLHIQNLITRGPTKDHTSNLKLLVNGLRDLADTIEDNLKKEKVEEEKK